MLKRFKIQDCKPIGTPMVTGYKLNKEDDSLEVEQKLYRSMIGSLLYVTTTRPDVMQAVFQVARFQVAPKETHLLAVKIISRYLKGTVDFGLWCPKANKLELFCFTEPDREGCVDDKKSTSGASFYLGVCLVLWSDLLRISSC